MPVSARTKDFSLLVCSVVILAVAAEFAVRVAYRDITTTGDNRSYFALKWKKLSVRLNSLGFRDAEPDRRLDTTRFRIAFIGDSFTFGQGIPEDRRMSNVIEAALLGHHGNIDVVNLGNPGNNTSAEVGVIRRALAELDPDFVLLQWYVNDVEGNGTTPTNGSGARPEPGTLKRLKQWLLNKSAVYFLASRAWHNLLTALGYGDADSLDREFRDPESEESRAATAALVEFLGLARSHGVPVGIVLVPDLWLLGTDNYEFAYLHDRVMRLCEQHSLTCLDLTAVFNAALRPDGRPQDLWVNTFDAHMGIKANEIAAQAILTKFGPVWTTLAAARERRSSMVLSTPQ